MAGRIAPLQSRRDRKPQRGGLPLPGIGGYDYPRGPYGATGFPGSAPAAPPTHPQTAQGIRGPREDGTLLDKGVPRWTITEQQAFEDRFLSPSGFPYNPKARNQPLATGKEHRETPVIGNPIGARQPIEKLRNTVARRVWAVPWESQTYLSSPNPGKNGGKPAYDRSAGYDNDAGTIVGGDPTPVTVQRRFVSWEGSQEGYAMNRPEVFSRGGVAYWPESYSGDRHLRGGRLTGQRYTGALADQQRIGIPSDAYGIARRRGPQHRPVRFETPGPWTANYYDTPPHEGNQAPDMIHRSPGRHRRNHKHSDRAKDTPRGESRQPRGGRSPRRR